MIEIICGAVLLVFLIPAGVLLRHVLARLVWFVAPPFRLGKMVTITGEVATSDIETRRTAELARHVDDLSYCVAKKRYDKHAACALRDKQARSILKCR